MKTVLIVAFHFPPYGGGSGILRILKFCRFLPSGGWNPVILTADPRAYEQTDPTLLSQVPAGAKVLRAFALDTRKHLSIRGRYLRWMALPDRWISWSFAAVFQGLRTILNCDVEVILSTYPIATALLIGWFLHVFTGKPWVVDFRDSMTEANYPADPLTRRIYRWIERKAVRRAERLIFTSPAALRMYQQRYPATALDKFILLPNGYDEEDFSWVSHRGESSRTEHLPLRLLHLGLIYPSERDPRPFFRAISRLKGMGKLSASDLRIELRASGNEALYSQWLQELGIEDLVFLLPALSYPQAIREAAASDALLLLQAANCDHQTPAKAYEYLRLGRPILALTSNTGDTAALLRETGGATIMDLADEQAIFDALPGFLAALRRGDLPIADLARVQKYDRRNQTRILADVLSTLVSVHGGAPHQKPQPVAEPKVP